MSKTSNYRYEYSAQHGDRGRVRGGRNKDGGCIHAPRQGYTWINGEKRALR